MKKNRFKSRETYKQLLEVDYMDKLSDEDKAWLEQFFMEYYQADFSYDKTIHPKALYKDCYNRNNSSKRQVHSVGQEKLKEYIDRSIDRSLKGDGKSNKYSLLDYNKDLDESEINKENQDDTEN